MEPISHMNDTENKDWVIVCSQSLGHYVHCICGHRVKRITYLYHKPTKAIQYVGKTCVRKYGIEFSLTNPILLDVIKANLDKAKWDRDACVREHIQSQYTTFMTMALTHESSDISVNTVVGPFRRLLSDVCDLVSEFNFDLVDVLRDIEREVESLNQTTRHQMVDEYSLCDSISEIASEHTDMTDEEVVESVGSEPVVEDEPVFDIVENPVEDESVFDIVENPIEDEPVFDIVENPVEDEPVFDIVENPVEDEPVFDIVENPVEDEPIVEDEPVFDIVENPIEDEPVFDIVENPVEDEPIVEDEPVFDIVENPIEDEPIVEDEPVVEATEYVSVFDEVEPTESEPVVEDIEYEPVLEVNEDVSVFDIVEDPVIEDPVIVEDSVIEDPLIEDPVIVQDNVIVEPPVDEVVADVVEGVVKSLEEPVKKKETVIERFLRTTSNINVEDTDLCSARTHCNCALKYRMRLLHEGIEELRINVEKNRRETQELIQGSIEQRMKTDEYLERSRKAHPELFANKN
jgi:hypothetical protein